MLQEGIDWLLYSILSLDPESRFHSAINFFLYDTIKIMLLLFFMIAIIGFLRTFVSPSRMKRLLRSRWKPLSHLFASLFGAVTPFCSCSSIPLFLSFLKGGIPLGVSFSFLITSPLINEYLVVLMLGLFGWKVTAIYVLSGIILGTVIGMVIGAFKPERYIEKGFKAKETEEDKRYDFRSRIIFGIDEALSIVKKIWVWVIIGVLVGALIHNFIPAERIHSIIESFGLLGVPAAVILGIPMYGSCAAIVPIAVVLFQKGVPLGTALAFMMAVTALSLPEAIILRRAMKLRLIALFFLAVGLAIIFTGYLINLVMVLS